MPHTEGVSVIICVHSSKQCEAMLEAVRSANVKPRRPKRSWSWSITILSFAHGLAKMLCSIDLPPVTGRNVQYAGPIGRYLLQR